MSLACRVVGAYVSNNAIAPDGVLEMLQDLITASGELGAAAPDARGRGPGAPAVPIEDSVTDDYLVCLEDGARFKSLRRHLSEKYNLTPDEYRARWGLPRNYPMVAPAYAKARSEIAKAREQRKREQAAARPAPLRPKSRRS